MGRVAALGYDMVKTYVRLSDPPACAGPLPTPTPWVSR